ncbi:unnamed protein product [Linum trigynum]|uniref:Uncharacterized protein n=1 Tax=Linum trigynum TaxID=586398 RepID=A0AAV2CAR3_9ROSI
MQWSTIKENPTPLSAFPRLLEAPIWLDRRRPRHERDSCFGNFLELGLRPPKVHRAAKSSGSPRSALPPAEEDEQSSEGDEREEEIPDETELPVSGITLGDRNIYAVHR